MARVNTAHGLLARRKRKTATAPGRTNDGADMSVDAPTAALSDESDRNAGSVGLVDGVVGINGRVECQQVSITGTGA